MHRLFQSLEHLLGLTGQRVQPGRRHVDAGGEADRQVGDCDQHPDHAQCMQRDLATALPHHRTQLGAQRESAPPQQCDASETEQAGPGYRVRADRTDRAGSRQQRDAREQNQDRTKRAFHLNAATADS